MCNLDQIIVSKQKTIGDVGDFGQNTKAQTKWNSGMCFYPHTNPFSNLETAFVCFFVAVFLSRILRSQRSIDVKLLLHSWDSVWSCFGLQWFTAAVGMLQNLNLDTSELFPIVRTIVKQCQVDKNHSRSLNGRSWEIWSTGVKFVSGFCYRIYRTSSYANVSGMFWLVFVCSQMCTVASHGRQMPKARLSQSSRPLQCSKLRHNTPAQHSCEVHDLDCIILYSRFLVLQTL